jgi:hypothetical protein
MRQLPRGKRTRQHQQRIEDVDITQAAVASEAKKLEEDWGEAARVYEGARDWGNAARAYGQAAKVTKDDARRSEMNTRKEFALNMLNFDIKQDEGRVVIRGDPPPSQQQLALLTAAAADRGVKGARAAATKQDTLPAAAAAAAPGKKKIRVETPTRSPRKGGDTIVLSHNKVELNPAQQQREWEEMGF